MSFFLVFYQTVLSQAKALDLVGNLIGAANNASVVVEVKEDTGLAILGTLSSLFGVGAAAPVLVVAPPASDNGTVIDGGENETTVSNVKCHLGYVSQ